MNLHVVAYEYPKADFSLHEWEFNLGSRWKVHGVKSYSTLPLQQLASSVNIKICKYIFSIAVYCIIYDHLSSDVWEYHNYLHNWTTNRYIQWNLYNDLPPLSLSIFISSNSLLISSFFCNEACFILLNSHTSRLTSVS